MAYRNLMVESPAHISCKQNQLVVCTTQTSSVPIEDICAVLIENRQTVITTAALAALAQNGSAVYVCDEKHLPCGVLLPFASHSRQLAVVRGQMEASLPHKKRLWQQVVQAKIANQAQCLALCGKQQEAAALLGRAKTVTSGDKENAEAAAAAYYFPALFGAGFTRSAQDGRNAALNYGYAILRGAMARSVAAYGFLPCLGLHHCSELNAFNLADDLMEPYRPVVDLYAAANISEDSPLTPVLKRCLYNLLNVEIRINNQRHSVAYAMEQTVQSLRRCTQDGQARLSLPTLLAHRQHGYE